MKILKYILILVVLSIVMFLILKNENATVPVVEVVEDKTEISKPDVANMTYGVDGDVFILKDGKAEIAIPNSSTKSILDLFGSVYGDLDGDRDTDAAVWLVNDSGGTGRFFYGALVINNRESLKATEAMFLGDRIAPQNIVIKDGRAVYNFAERRADEPMTAEPTVARSVWVNYDIRTGEISELAVDFEGEAEPSKMTLGMKTWQWVSTTYSDGKKIVPKDSSKFTLTFNKDGSFSSSTDCNGVGGNYVAKNNKLTFSEMMGTLMYCEGAQEGDFKKILSEAQSYFFTSKGELVIDLKFDSGSATFR